VWRRRKEDRERRRRPPGWEECGLRLGMIDIMAMVDGRRRSPAVHLQGFI